MPLPIYDNTPVQVPTSTNLSINGSLKLPTMEEILDGTIHTTRHVPKNCRSKLAKALTEVCNAITKNPSYEEGYKLLFMFPSCCLRAPPRTGRQKRNQATKFIDKLLERWLQGDVERLWRESQDSKARAKQQKGTSTQSPEKQRKRNIQRALLMIEEGNLTKTVQCLQSLGVAAPTEQTIEQLEEKHPKGPAVTVGRNTTVSNLSVSPEEILQQTQTFTAASSPGRSSLRFEHLLAAFQSPIPSISKHCLDSFTSLVNLLLTGDINKQAASHICGAKLIPLKKSDDSVRPIAVGDTLRRITSKCACRHVTPTARSLLFPHQVGVAVSAGCEAVIHSVRDCLWKNSPD